jgi:dnd system-associated protein 4
MRWLAASLAAARDQTLPFTESAKEPIRQQVFENQGFGSLLGMLAVHKEQNPSLLSDDESMEERRAQIFEAYANAGLQILKDELRGAPNLSEAILLLLQKEKELSGQTAEDEVEFDLRSLLS